MTAIPKIDNPYESATLTYVESNDDGWSIGFGGWGLFVPNDQCAVSPKVGEKVELYGRGVGYSVRGIVIGGRVYRYLTEEQEQRRHHDEVKASKRERREKLAAERADRDRRIAALPPEFRTRLERFHAVGGDEWRAEFEPYELFVCEEAVKIVKSGKAGTTVDTEVLREVLGETYDEHSGNTMASAVGLARAAFKGVDLARVHGALCSLVGCADYKCWHAGGSEN